MNNFHGKIAIFVGSILVVSGVAASAETISSGVTDAVSSSVFCGSASQKSTDVLKVNGISVIGTASTKIGSDKLGGNYAIATGSGSLQVSSFSENTTTTSQQSGKLSQYANSSTVSSFGSISQ